MDTQKSATPPGPSGPMVGVRIVEFAQVIAGPMAGTLMADQGAEVVHVEPPGAGDSARYMGPEKEGTHLWWKVLGRNKRSVTLDLHNSGGRDLARKLIEWADVVIVTFRGSTAQRFGLDWESVHAVNRSAILLQITGYGARSSKADAPGLGKMAEARSGVVNVTGFSDGPPVHTGFSHGDTTSALLGAFAVATALHRRERDPKRNGEWIDLALSDALMRLLEWQIIYRDQLGISPRRAGNQLAVAPAAVINVYQTVDGEWITVTTATLRTVTAIVDLLGLDRRQFESRDMQLARSEDLDNGLRAWISTRTAAQCVTAMEAFGVVASKVFDVDDIMGDPIFAERDVVVEVRDADLGTVKMAGVAPQFVHAPGAIWRTGPGLGADNGLVYGAWLGISKEDQTALYKNGAI